MATACSLLSRFRAISLAASRTLAKHALSIRPSPIALFRPLICASEGLRLLSDCRGASVRCFSTSSIQDPSPNWSNRLPKETLLDGCDFEHWQVFVEKPAENLSREEIIDSYIKTLAQVVGSEEEARMKVYSVSTMHYFGFGALVSEELSDKIRALPGVRWVLPDSYLDVRNKNYGGEPFIDGQAVPYDPKYHEEWLRINARAKYHVWRSDRPRNNDRSRNFERRRENMQSRDFQSREAPPMPNFPNAASPTQPGQGEPPPNTFRQTPPNQMPNPQPGLGFPSPPGHGYQEGPPGGGGGQGYQAGPPGGPQGYQASPLTGQGYQSGPPGGQRYPGGPPGGQGYQAGPPINHGYQAVPPINQGYQAGPPGGQGYPVGGRQSSSDQGSQGGGPAGGPANSQNGNPGDQGNLGGYRQGGSNAGFQSGNAG